ncbi:glycosyltransferase family 4 protein [Methylocucumis oryzae]|uniref:Glycosyltransferase subfamily 4-like N-terminal domain-containing protein n=1 Tax=Methylocucumis oryzae TaxID=1632867 RepID=A0A0F3IHI2_9GAMM|nr:glycosyltransferase family 4 protein [Methylocucumis oryzae]KJV06250.1 hypothetical protein VZ94_12555 [Methylocucumis oryzae]
MRITFIVPSLNVTGGLRVISIYATYLSKQGHSVTVISPSAPMLRLQDQVKSLAKNRQLLKNKFDTTFFNQATYEVNIIENSNHVSTKDVPDADIVIATFWNTAEWIAEFPASKGKKVYFLQHYEIHPWLPIERVKATLRLPYRKIAVASWIADIMNKEYGDSDVAVVPNGVDPNLFFATERIKQNKPTIGFMYSKREFKGCDLAIEAFNRAQAQITDLQLVVFGPENNIEKQLPNQSQYFYRPAQDKLREIYALCDAWLFSSRTEGFGLPILEAMACHTPVIGTHCGAAPDIITRENGRLIPIDDIDAMTSCISEIVSLTPQEWLRMSTLAYETSTKWHWQHSCNLFEQNLFKFLEEAQ